MRLIKNSKLPADRKSPAYNAAIRQLHAAILGVCALVDSYPYTIERWMPELLTNVLAEHTYDPVSRVTLDKSGLPDGSVDSHFHDCPEVRKHVPEDASRHLARRLEEVY